MNISMKNLTGLSFSPAGMLKSTKERKQRRADMESQVDAFKEEQAALKNRECDTVESIAEKLELYHSYESEIAAVKKAYNLQEMSHVMDEAAERGEKIAEAAEESRPKTQEERRKEALEEATGTKEGLLSKLLEDSLLPEEDTDAFEKLAEDFDYSGNLEKLKELLSEAGPDGGFQGYEDYAGKLAELAESLYREDFGSDSFEDSVTLLAKAFGEMQDRINELDLTGEERLLHMKELSQSYDRYAEFAAVSKRIMTEIRQRFHKELEGVDPGEVEEITRQVYHDAISEENLMILREGKASANDRRLSFSVSQEWLTLLGSIYRG